MNINSANMSKEPWFAVNLSMFFAGIGQVYSGRVVRGCIFIFGQIALTCFGGGLVLSSTGNVIIGASFLLAGVVVYIWSLFDAHKCSREANTEDFGSSRKENKDPWLAVFLSRILPGLGHMYIRKWGWGVVFIVCLIIVSIIEESHLSFLICGAIFSAFVCYHAYISSPVHREASKNLIMIIAIVIFAIELVRGYLPVFVRENVVQAFRIPTKAMEPTLRVGDGILVKKFAKYVPKRGDLVVFICPQDRSRVFIKRLVAIGGETVEIRGDGVYINGNRLKDSPFQNIRYVSMGKFGIEGKPFVVPNHSLFVLGDNSRSSWDSRFFGSVPEADVIGKAYKIYWPPNRMGPIE